MKRTAPAARLIAVTAAICVAVLVASWMLLLGPKLDAAAATRTQADTVRAQNAALQGSLDALRADFENIDELRTELAGLRLQLPHDADLPGLSREIHAAAQDAGVTLERVEVTDAVDVSTAAAAAAATAAAGAPAAGAAAAAPAATGDTGAADAASTPASVDAAATAAAAASGTAAPGTTGVATPSAPPVPGLLLVPVTTTVHGSLTAVRSYLSALQGGLDRSLLVTSLGITALEASTGADGTPAVAPGDIRVVVGAYAYVLPPAPAADAAPAPVEGG